LCLPVSNFKLIKQVYCHRYDLNLSPTSHKLGDALLLRRRSTLFLQEYNTRWRHWQMWWWHWWHSGGGSGSSSTVAAAAALW
jgi:hypothetical protein